MAPDGQHWDVGAYVLGVLDPGEVEPFEAHLAACDYCADEVGSLLPVVGGLASVNPAALTGTAAWAATEGGNLASVSWLADETPRRRARNLPRHGHLAPAGSRTRLLVAASVTAIVVSGISFLAGSQFGAPGAPAVAATSRQSDAPATKPPATKHVEATDPVSKVHADIDLVSARWGTQVDLTVDGVHGPLRCELIAIDGFGRSTVVASWTVIDPGYGIPEQPTPLHLEAATATTVSATTRFEIRSTDPNGRSATLVTMPV